MTPPARRARRPATALPTGPFSRSTVRSCSSTTARSSTCCSRSSPPRASWDAFFEHTRIRPVLVLYENFAADYETSTLNILDRLGLEAPADLGVEPEMRRQSDGINDDWAKRFSELRLGTEFDLVPAVAASGDA